MQRDTEEGRDNQSAEFVWLQPYVWAKTDIINQSQGVSACSFGGSLGAVAVRSCLFFSPWTGIGVWKVNWATWGQKQISNVIESKCGFIEANLIGPIGSNSFMFDQSNQSSIIVVLLLIKNLHLEKSEESSVFFHRLGKSVVLQLYAFPASSFFHYSFAVCGLNTHPLWCACFKFWLN